MEAIYISKHTGEPLQVEIPLASSKSESNRALIINALGGFKSDLQNLSSARDTQTMIRLLKSEERTIDVLDAGTTMRFLTAYFSVLGQNKIMTGTPRMCERPIGILVDALRTIGVQINYLAEEGFPPFEIVSFEKQIAAEVSIKANVSSQYISALLMIGAALPLGLQINLLDAIGSKPYIEMTIAQLKEFGIDVQVDWEAQILKVGKQDFGSNTYMVESDWSGASYWFSIVALSQNPDTKIYLKGLKARSLQGDSAIVEIMQNLGVNAVFDEGGVQLTWTPTLKDFEYDFTDCPDLVQTVVACAAALKVQITMTGIESLKIKETDRVFALKTEIAKVGVDWVEVVANQKYTIEFISENPDHGKPVRFHTYDDHRMAMAFAPLFLKYDIIIDEPSVVAKSYPEYWDHLSKIAKLKPIA